MPIADYPSELERHRAIVRELELLLFACFDVMWAPQVEAWFNRYGWERTAIRRLETGQHGPLRYENTPRARFERWRRRMSAR